MKESNASSGRWTAAEMRERRRSMPDTQKPRERQRPPDPANPVAAVKRNHHGAPFKLLTREALDQRTRPAQLFNRIVGNVYADLGGESELTQLELGLVDAYALAYVHLDDLAARTLLGQSVDPGAVSQCTNSMVKVASRLGLRRRLKDVTPDLQTYLQARAREANDDVVEADVVEDEYDGEGEDD